jgi:Zn-dependent peptidase ImmA (M78 family)/plasmid maintenance system antidote protein VapI
MSERAEIGARLLQQRDRLGFSQQRAAELLGIDRPRLSGIERGERPIDAGMLSRIARLYGVSAGVLLGLEEPEEVTATDEHSVMRFRTHLASQDKEVELRGFLTFMERYRRLLKYADEAPQAPDLLQSKLASDTHAFAVEADAKRLRNHWGLGDAPVGLEIFSLLEDHGIGVYREALPNSTISGAYYRGDAVGTVLFVNATEWPYRQVFTTAHELAHLVFDHISGYSEWRDSSTEEQLCNRFASVFLMPEDAIETHLATRSTRREGVDVDDVLSLHRAFGVSYYAMLVRLRSLGIIKKDRYNELSQRRPVVEALRHGYVVENWEIGYETSEVPYKIRAKWFPRPFVRLVHKAARDGFLSEGKAAEYLHLELDEWLAFSNEPQENPQRQAQEERDKEDSEFAVR